MKKGMFKKYYSRYRYQAFFVFICVALGLLGLGLSMHEREKMVSAPIQVIPTPTPPKAETYKMPILMYHYIREAPADLAGQKLSVSPENFENQVKWLKENNYASIQMSDVSDPDRVVISKLVAEHKKPIAITFDDGYDDAYTNALPILKKYGFNGTFYIIRDDVGKPHYMTQTQIDELHAAGMEIGSHTLSHPDLATISAEDARRQIFDSKMGAKAFCYPSGKFNPTVEGFVKEAGYLSATTTNFGIADQNSNPFELPRIRMSNMDLAKFQQELNGIE